MPHSAGTRLGPYEIIAPLGAGGMGEVYRAKDTRLGRDVAIKVLPSNVAHDADRLARFEREARAVAALNHPNILALFDVGTHDGSPFVVTELLEGETLRDRLEKGALLQHTAVDIGVEIAHGLAAAHAKGIVHRDLKPANVFVTGDGVVKLLDFGLAKLTRPEVPVTFNGTTVDREPRTESGTVLGTMGYMSPEQLRGETADARSDIFAFGCVLYEMLSGKSPFLRASGAETITAIMSEDPESLSGTGRAITPPLREIVKRCLEKRPGDRFSSVHDLALALQACSGVRESARWQEATGWRGWQWLRKKPALAIGVALATTIAIAVFVTVLTPHGAARKWLRLASVPVQQHMAVLPFTNVGNDPANRAFCDGLTEILASTLTQLERFQGQLWVVPASEVRTREIRSAGEARKVFNVNLVFGGGVQREGDRVRLALNLVDTESLRQLRSKVIEGTSMDLASLEDRVVAAMAEMLDVQLKPDQRKELTAGGTKVAAAYDLYVQARGALGSYQGERDPQKAVDLFKKAIALDPSFVLAHTGLSEAYLELFFWNKDPRVVDEATTSALRAAELNDRLAEVHTRLGAIYTTTGKYEDAVREYQRALEIDPRSSGALGGLARALDSLGRPADAEVAHRQAITLRPGYWLTYSRLGNFYAAHGRYDDAERQLKQVIALTPESVWGYNNLGALYYTLGRYPQAREMFERALSIQPSYALYSNLGTLAFIQGEWAEAVAKFEQARALDDRDYVLWGNLGSAYHWLGQHDEQSREAWTKAVSLAEKQLVVNPRETAVLVDLASYYASLGNKDKALECVRRAEMDAHKQPDLAVQVADVFVDLGDRERALEWIATALRLGCPVGRIESAPSFKRLSSDPRYVALVKTYRK